VSSSSSIQCFGFTWASGPSIDLDCWAGPGIPIRETDRIPYFQKEKGPNLSTHSPALSHSRVTVSKQYVPAVLSCWWGVPVGRGAVDRHGQSAQGTNVPGVAEERSSGRREGPAPGGGRGEHLQGEATLERNVHDVEGFTAVAVDSLENARLLAGVRVGAAGGVGFGAGDGDRHVHVPLGASPYRPVSPTCLPPILFFAASAAAADP
jgi:hypothetical protein